MCQGRQHAEDNHQRPQDFDAKVHPGDQLDHRPLVCLHRLPLPKCIAGILTENSKRALWCDEIQHEAGRASCWIYISLRVIQNGPSCNQPTFVTPHRPIRIASAASCLSEVGRAAPDHSMTCLARVSAWDLAS